jgi:hypothetical protein
VLHGVCAVSATAGPVENALTSQHDCNDVDDVDCNSCCHDLDIHTIQDGSTTGEMNADTKTNRVSAAARSTMNTCTQSGSILYI